ncbi:hypothetical protein BvCms854_04157 [Escherichia coli]|nr:hypothetical protein QMY48_04672 [Escherichia coli]GCN76916.1 hypothetical protein BvCms854_04157 [Escherichia coli]CAD6038336.1 Uncharacterised protein [Escherichia coli]CAD6152669.1 Uncharacterised protein [Escherichia coli]STG05187.1 Uncharacterised protein [Escherichia coli]
MRIMLILLCFFSFPCFSGDKIKIVKTCQLKKMKVCSCFPLEPLTVIHYI